MAKRKYKYENDRTLGDLFDDARDFSLVLPHFQREFIWEAKKDQKPLLQSMLAGIPIGSILLLTDKSDSYASRRLCLRGFEPQIKGDQCTFLLDGQQRISTLKSILSDLFSKEEMEVLQKDDWKDLLGGLPPQLRYRWFLKIDAETDDDIFGIKSLDFKDAHDDGKPFSPADFDDCIEYKKLLKSQAYDYDPGSSLGDLVDWAVREKSVPLFLLGTTDDTIDFERILKYIARKEHAEELKKLREEKKEYEEYEAKIERWAKKVVSFLENRTLKATIPSITLEGKVGMELGIYIFEQVNRGGVKLDVYDLLVARMALYREEGGENLNLTEGIEKLCKPTQAIKTAIYDRKSGFEPSKMGIWDEKKKLPALILKKMFKNCLAICNLKNKGGLQYLVDKFIKENNLLDLSADEIYKNWEETIETLFLVMQFLHFRCGVVKLKDIPYELLVVPLFVFFLKYENKPEKEDIDKIEFWYWASIFCGHYREKQSSRIIEDSKKIINNKEFHKAFYDRRDGIFADGGYSDKESLTRKRPNSSQPPLDKTIIQYMLAREPSELDSENKRIKLPAYYFAEADLKFEKKLHYIIPEEAIPGAKSSKLKKDLNHPINSVLNKVLIRQKANWKIEKLSDYNDQHKFICEQNIIPNPTDQRFMRNDKPYALDEFLSARFDKIKEHVRKHLQTLIAEPPTR